MSLWSWILQHSLSVEESANPTHGIMAFSEDVAYIQSGSSLLWVGYGNSPSSYCFFMACFCIRFMASPKAVGLGTVSISHFNTPPHPALGIAGECRDIGVSCLDPWPEPSAWESSISMGEPGGRPSSNLLSHLVIGKAMPLVRPPTSESPDPPEVGKWMGGMVMVSSPYTGGVRGPGAGEAFPNAKGLNTLSKPNSLLSLVSCPVCLFRCSIQLRNIRARSLAVGLAVPVWIISIIGQGCHNTCYFGLFLPSLAHQQALWWQLCAVSLGSSLVFLSFGHYGAVVQLLSHFLQVIQSSVALLLPLELCLLWPVK